MSKTRVARVAIAILMGAGLSCVVSPQQPETKTEQTRCGFLEVYQKEGWTIPGHKNAKTTYRAAFKNLPGVYVVGLLPSEPETTMLTISCSRGHPDRLEIEDLPIRILDLTAYEFNGQVFAYGVSYEKQAIQNGVRVPLGAASGILFYDPDGSGRFTVRKYASWPFTPDPPLNERVTHPSMR